LKVVTVSGVVKPEVPGSMEEEPKKEKDDKKSMQGVLNMIPHSVSRILILCSYRRNDI